MNRKLFWFLFVSITLLAVSFRFFKLGSIPVSLYWDEVAILADARIVAETSRDMHGNHWFQALFPSYGDYKLPVYIWFATLAVKVLGATELAVRVPSALAGLFTLFVGFFLAKEFTQNSKSTVRSEYVSLAALLTIATSFWSIMFSRTAFEGHLAQALVAFSVLLVFKSKKRSWLLLLSALIGALAVYTYYSVRFVWPVIFLVAAGIVYFQSFEKNKKLTHTFIMCTVLSLITFFVALIPMSRSPHYAASQQYRLSAQSVLQQDTQIHEANYYRLLSGNTFLDRIFFHRHLLTLKLLASNYSKNLSLEYIFLTGDPNLRHGTTQHGLYALVLIIPFFLGLFILFKDDKKILLLLFVWWLISLLPASVPLETPHALRSLNALVPTALIISYGLAYFFVLDTPLKKIVSTVFFTIFAFQVFAFWHHYRTYYPQDSAQAWQDGYKQLAKKVVATQNEPGEVWISIPDKKIYLWFLAYSYYAPQEIQKWEKPAFQLKQFDRITIKESSLSDLNSSGNPIILVAEPATSEKLVEETDAKFIKMEYSLDSFKKPVFVLNYFNPKNEN